MKHIIYFLFLAIAFISCKDNKKKESSWDEKMISLHSDTINLVKLTDTLIIYESTCRGCAMEGSTHFNVEDSLGIIKLVSIKTFDNNPSDMSGGNISKNLLLVPVKTGTTTIKLYKFWDDKGTAKDSARFTPYTIEVRN